MLKSSKSPGKVTAHFPIISPLHSTRPFSSSSSGKRKLIVPRLILKFYRGGTNLFLSAQRARLTCHHASTSRSFSPRPGPYVSPPASIDLRRRKRNASAVRVLLRGTFAQKQKKSTHTHTNFLRGHQIVCVAFRVIASCASSEPWKALWTGIGREQWQRSELQALSRSHALWL